MREPAFTRGPWQVGATSTPREQFGVHAQFLATHVAVVSGEANARLIAAAPALYEAVEWICRLAALPDGALDEDWNAAIDSGMIALSLALGEK